MSIAKVTEITASSTESFEDAIRKGVARAAETIHGMQAAWVQEQSVVITDGAVSAWRVNLKITFMLD